MGRERGQAENHVHPKGFGWGLRVSSDPMPSPTVARHNGNPSAHREPSLMGEGKYSLGAPSGMFPLVCWSRALFPVTFKVFI